MCSRYTQTSKTVILRTKIYGDCCFEFTPRYNISPAQQVDVVRLDRGRPASRQMRWGWHHKKFGSINSVEAHGAYHKIYQEAWKTGRCLIPADGYFQWKSRTSAEPYRIVMVTRKPFWFAGLHKDGEVLILTAPAFGWLAASFDHRQPIALPQRELDWWLNDSKEYRSHESWAVINRAICASAFLGYPVVPAMTHAHFDSPECVVPIFSPESDVSTPRMAGCENGWNDVSERPLPGKAVDLLLDDDTVTHGQWNGKEWEGLRFENSFPIRWRRQPDKISINANARGI
jgi:putative SOS response-associated peptidase YedK